MLRFLFNAVNMSRRFYWWAMRPATRGVRAILVNPDGKILLLRHGYSEGWYLPGGANKRGETDEASLHRELREELGITQFADVTKLGEYLNQYEYKNDTITVFVIKTFVLAPRRHFEVERWGFFDPSNLPDDTSPGTRRRIEEWRSDSLIEARKLW